MRVIRQTAAQINAKRSQQTYLMKRTFTNLCIPSFGPPPVFLCAISSGANILNTNLLASSMTKITSTATEPENLQYFYVSDHLGSSSWITDKDGNALQHLSYLPFGEVFANQKASGSSFDAEFKFSGKPLDLETGYSYFGARYLDSKLGLWLSVDPMAGEYPSISPYAYCANNPIKYIDPDGQRFIDANGNRVRVRVKRDGTISYKFAEGTSIESQSTFKDNHAPSLSAMATTKDGQKNIRFMNRTITNIEIKPDNAVASQNSQVFPELDANGEPKMIGDVYDKVTIVPHMGTIEAKAQRDGIDAAEILGATMMVESGHLKAKQIALDNNAKKTNAEKYFKLYNDFVDFRYEYRQAKNQSLDKTIFNNSSTTKPELNRSNTKRLEEVAP